MWLQQYVLIEDALRQRQREEMPPAARLLQSPFDLEARYSHKRSRTWMGYKVHLSETCGEDMPHLITHIHTTNATEPDVDAVEPIHDDLQQQDLLPDEHLVDRGYTSAPLLYDSRSNYGVNLLGPVVEKHTWQQATGYEIDAFTIDWEKRQVTCPQGKVSQPWTMREHRHCSYPNWREQVTFPTCRQRGYAGVCAARICIGDQQLTRSAARYSGKRRRPGQPSIVQSAACRHNPHHDLTLP